MPGNNQRGTDMNARITTTSPATTTTTISTGTIIERARIIHSDSECRARASEFLTELIGSPPDSLSWDDAHHLQGHGQVQGRELVVIAPRDDDHHTVVLTAEDWDAVRRCSTAGRRQLLDQCAIVDHAHLVAALRPGNGWTAPLVAAA